MNDIYEYVNKSHVSFQVLKNADIFPRLYFRYWRTSKAINNNVGNKQITKTDNILINK